MPLCQVFIWKSKKFLMPNRILIVDDDEMVLRALDSFLSDQQYLIQTVDRAEKIEVAVSRFAPQLIILEIRLDTSDGRLICDDLKSSSKTAHIPIVLLTALNHREIALIECQADAIIGKPFEGSSLLPTIRDLINNKFP